MKDGLKSRSGAPRYHETNKARQNTRARTEALLILRRINSKHIDFVYTFFQARVGAG